MNYVIVIFLVLLSGLFSGLTLGLLSLDKNELRRKVSLGNKKAIKVYAVRKHGNLLLSTLLLGNVAVNSTVAIFLGNIASGIIAGVVSTGLIVIFGEIIPQAVFARHAMEFGSRTAWLVKIIIVFFLPICWPIAWVLDKALGEEMTNIYSKKELMKIVEEHEDSMHSDIDEDEERIILGALSFSDKIADDIMTPRNLVFALEENSIIDKKLLKEIKEEGYSRIPVYSGTLDNITGILYIKDLIGAKEGTKILSLCHKTRVMTVLRTQKLDKLLTDFIKSRTHLAFVNDRFNNIEGVVALEDVIEEILKTEILDESDDREDNKNRRLKKTAHNKKKNKSS